MSKQTVRFYDPVEETLAKLYKENLLEKPNELPLDARQTLLLAPNGNYLRLDNSHAETMRRFMTKRLLLPNGVLRPLGQEHQDSFYKDLNIIRVGYEPDTYNRLDFVFTKPLTPEQLRTIYKTYKDIPDLWITYDVVDRDKPFSVSGEGYREMIADLRKKNYMPNEQ